MCDSCMLPPKEPKYPSFELSKMPWYEDKEKELTIEEKLEILVQKLDEACKISQEIHKDINSRDG